MEKDQALRQHVLKLLQMKGAHVNFDKAVSGFPENLRGKKLDSAPYTAWELLEHLRISQWDILDFCRNPNYASMEWPKEYWPSNEAPPDNQAWEKSAKQFQTDLKDMQKLVEDTDDLFARIPHGSGQTILREALLVADHNAYHLGQLVLLRRFMGAW